MSALYFLLLFLISSSHGWFIKKSKPDCITKKSCVSCTLHKSWSGSSCRWCPSDGKCHAHGAVFTNPCSRSENIVNKGSCSSIVTATYDNILAYKMVYHAAVAYADDAAKYLSKAREVNTFRLSKQVTKSCPGNARCSGYTALSHTERAIVIAFRGSETKSQVIYQSIKILTSPKVSFQAGGRVQGYFNDAFVLIWNELKPAAYKLISTYPSYKVWVTGHSLGGAIASLASTVIATEGKTTKTNLILYTFGQPRVGNYDYALKHDRFVPISFRVTHYRDPVVHLPTCKKVVPLVCYAYSGGPYHHGKEIFYNRESMTKYSSYKNCRGLPYNEDLGCSNKFSVWSKCLSPWGIKKCINDHHVYFGIRVGLWWKSQ